MLLIVWGLSILFYNVPADNGLRSDYFAMLRSQMLREGRRESFQDIIRHIRQTLVMNECYQAVSISIKSMIDFSLQQEISIINARGCLDYIVNYVSFDLWVTLLLHLVCLVLADCKVPRLTKVGVQESLAHCLRFDSWQLYNSSRLNRGLTLSLRVLPEHLHYGSRISFIILIESVKFLPCLKVFSPQTKQGFKVLIDD